MNLFRRYAMAFSIIAGVAFFPQFVRADAVIDWNVRICNIVTDADLPTPYANRAMAIVHTAVYEAVNAITKKYSERGSRLEAPPDASIEAAVAAASRTTLLDLLPSQKTAIESAYQAALSKIPDGKSKADGIAIGEKAAKAILSSRADDGVDIQESYRPQTVAGAYVPTTLPIVSQWPQRKPWVMTSASQFRPGPPPELTSEVWARDYREIKRLGAKNGSQRTTEQTEVARFWETTGPTIYHGIIRSVAQMPGRDVMRNARFFAAVTRAVDDAMIAVFDAKYHYNFWRPITAIRNGDIDGNSATDRDPVWTPFIPTPMHPEYPCAHCIVAGCVGAVIKAELGPGVATRLTTSSPTANGTVHSWTSVEDFTREVENGRVFDGVHFRNSAEVGTRMGRQIGELAAAKYLKIPG